MLIILLEYRIVESFESVISQYAQNIAPNASINFNNPSVSVRAEKVSIHWILRDDKVDKHWLLC